MKILSVFGSALSLTRAVWLETLFLAAFIIPTIWGGLELLSRGVNVRILQFAFMVPQALFTAFSAVVLYQAFDNRKNNTEVELSTERLISLTVSISLVTFLLNIITSIGSMLCFVPGIIAMTGFFLTQITLFKEDTKVLDSLYQSWGKTDGYRLDIFFLLLLAGVAASLLVLPLFGGAIYRLYDSGMSGAAASIDGFMFQVGIAVVLGSMSALGFSFSRALEYTVYTEISPPMDRWLKPAAALGAPITPITRVAPVMSPESSEPGEPEPAPAPVQPAFRAPIEVGEDIVFGKDAKDDKEGW